MSHYDAEKKIQRKKLQKFYNNYLIFGIFIVRMSPKYREVVTFVKIDYGYKFIS